MRKKILEITSILGRSLKGKIRYIILVLLGIVCYFGWKYLEANVFIEIPEVVEEYCNNKYGGEFQWVEFDLEESGTMSKMSIVSDGEVSFHVNRYYTTEDELCYTDDYYSHKYQEELNSEIASVLPDGSTGSILVEETTIGDVEKDSISVGDLLEAEDTTLVMSVNTDHLWNLEEAESFAGCFPCRISVFLYTNDETSHFISTGEKVVFR